MELNVNYLWFGTWTYKIFVYFTPKYGLKSIMACCYCKKC